MDVDDDDDEYETESEEDVEGEVEEGIKHSISTVSIKKIANIISIFLHDTSCT
jgi:hypothetical protein